MFINDILIYSWSENEHVDHLRIFLHVLKDRQNFAKFSKCQFWLRSIAFLGHIFLIKGIEVDLKKTDVVKSWPRPLTLSTLEDYWVWLVNIGDLLKFFIYCFFVDDFDSKEG